MGFIAKVKGTLYLTNNAGEGVFSQSSSGATIQHLGNAQTPQFKSNKSFYNFVYRKFYQENL